MSYRTIHHVLTFMPSTLQLEGGTWGGHFFHYTSACFKFLTVLSTRVGPTPGGDDGAEWARGGLPVR